VFDALPSNSLPTKGAAGVGGAFSPMMRFVTLVTVATDEDNASAGAAGSSSTTGMVEVIVEAFALPKLSFHRDGFFVGADGGTGGPEGSPGELSAIPGRYAE